MDFLLTDERRMLADMMQRFIGEQYGFAERTRIAYGEPGYSPAMWRRFGEQGAIAALFDPDDGGLGGEPEDIAVVFEALGRGLIVEPFLDALMSGSVLAEAGGPHRGHLQALMEGTAALALAHQEDDGFEAAAIATTASRQDGQWRLDGAKAMVACAAAERFVVSARTAGLPGQAAGVSLFLVPADAPGLQVRRCTTIDGGCAADLDLSGVRVPDGALLGQAGAGHDMLERALGRGLLALCAEAVGAMDAARQATLEHLRTRVQFGGPIGRFQALQHRMVELLIEIEQARSAVINATAALQLQAGRHERERALSAAKHTIGRAGILVAEECIQLHGGIGMTWELPLAHYAKRLVMIDHQLGDEDQHLARYIALGQAEAEP